MGQVHSPGRPLPDAEPVIWRGLADCFVPHRTIEAIPHEDVIAHFVRCLRDGKQPVQSARQQLHVHEIMFGAYRSAESGKRYGLTTTFTPWEKLNPAVFDTRGDYI
ncbi:hypothetical protein [Paenibacillus sp. GYB003]|uniref:hypothetical protein n=1 Tax=Paenibacillus sp. GYB003 TaxID=2994392 RepID=UPI002F960D93